jgi:hypothetical protein
MSLFLQEHVNVILEDLDASSRRRTLLGSQEIENMIEQLADREKQLQYAHKNKKTKGGAYSSYHR